MGVQINETNRIKEKSALESLQEAKPHKREAKGEKCPLEEDNQPKGGRP